VENKKRKERELLQQKLGSLKKEQNDKKLE
jgi:hypothetical protein